MLKTILKTIFLCMAVSNNCHTQNLVPNPSFEDTIQCPDGISQINYAENWYSPTTGSPDYFNLCSTGSVAIPLNGFGYQVPVSGNGYSGLYAFNRPTPDIREYIQTELLSVLKADSVYRVTFFISLAESVSNTAITNIGLYFSYSPISSGTNTNLTVTPQITSPIGVYLDDTLSWTPVIGYYKAIGGEKYITIGNFKNDADSDTTSWNLNDPVCAPFCYPISYYYIDDVSVVRKDTILSTSELTNNSNFNLYPNPNNGNMILSYELKAGETGEIRLYNYTGQQVGIYPLNPSGKQITIGSNNLANGVYTYRISVNGKLSATDKIVVLK